MAPTDRFGHALAQLMENRPEPLSISELARRAGVPRSTVHRHLKGGKPIRATLRAYAEALGLPEAELLTIAGYRNPESEGFGEDVRALALEISRLSPEDRDRLWQILALLKGGRGSARGEGGG